MLTKVVFLVALLLEFGMDVVVCPFVGCTAGKRGAPAQMGWGNAHKLRHHINESHAGFVPSESWFQASHSRICPGCSVAITSLKGECVDCRRPRKPAKAHFKQPQPRKAPKADLLPELQHNRWDPVSLGLNKAAVAALLPALQPPDFGVLNSLESPCVGSVDCSSTNQQSTPSKGICLSFTMP